MYGIEFTFENKINDFLQLRFNLGLVNGYIDYSSSQISNSQTAGNHVQVFLTVLSWMLLSDHKDWPEDPTQQEQKFR